MYNYQSLIFNRKLGGYRVVFTGAQVGLTSGRYTISPDRLPDLSNGFIPAGTPIFMDDASNKRSFDIHYAFAVYEKESTGTGTSVKIKKGWEGSRVQVGMNLMIMPSAVDGTGTGVSVTAVDRSNADYDVLTLAEGGLAKAVNPGDILVEASQTGASAKIKVLPNALQPYDLPKEPGANMVWTDGAFSMPDGVVLENRIPPIADAVKEYMLRQGVFFRYSKSDE